MLIDKKYNGQFHSVFNQIDRIMIINSIMSDPEEESIYNFFHSAQPFRERFTGIWDIKLRTRHQTDINLKSLS